MCAAGTQIFVPVRRQALPSRTALVDGRAGSSASASSKAPVRTTSPRTTPGRKAVFCAAEPNSAIGSAPSAIVAQNGTGATARPISSSKQQSSMTPRLLPPNSSGKHAPSRFALASSPQSSRSKPSSLFSITLMRSCVALSVRILRASSASAFWSSL